MILNDTFEFLDEEADTMMQQGHFDIEDFCFRPIYIYTPLLTTHLNRMQDESGSLFKPMVAGTATRSNEDVLDSLGDTPLAENPATAVTGGGAFKMPVTISLAEPPES